MKLVLDLPTSLGNARLHWAQKARAKKRYYAACDNRQLLGFVPPPPPQPIERCELRAHFRLHNTMDSDNLAARLKHALDWLVTRGYLADDRPAVIGTPIVTQEIDRKYKRLEITLTQEDPQ